MSRKSYGIRGELVDLETGKREPTRDRVGRLLEQLAPVGARLGNSNQLEAVGVLPPGTGQTASVMSPSGTD